MKLLSFLFLPLLAVLFSCSADNSLILTPKSGLKPRINGTRLYGVRPGSPFLYRIPATGERQMKFVVIDLPSGLTCNDSTGVIPGHLIKQANIK